jgi:hypothetical protein
MLQSIKRNIAGKAIIAILAFSAVGFFAESCGQKHACGSMHQKKQRNKRIKHNTTFMTY